VALIVGALDVLLVLYVLAHGFSSTTGELHLDGVSLQLQWLPVFGVVIVSIAALQDAFTRVFPRWLGPEADPIARLRLLRVVTVCLAAFACILYVPYLLGSNWFWLHLSHASRVLRQLEGFGTWLQGVESPILAWDPVWQYSLTEILASAALIFSIWILARPTRRPRRIR
jgi:hypothetical protein